MKIKLTIPQILCRNVTHPRTDADEIYLAYYISLARVSEDKTEVRKHLVKKISSIKNGVKKGNRWSPDSLETIVETGDADSLFVTFGLYEADDKKIYKKLKEKSDILVEPESYDWSGLEIPVDFTNWMSWVKAIWKAVTVSYTYLVQDDLIGKYSIAVPRIKGEDRAWLGNRELKFSSFGGDYRVSLLMEEVK